MRDRFEELVDRLLAALLAGAGRLSPAVREGIFARAARSGGAARNGDDAPDALRPLVDKIARDPTKVTDDDYQRLVAAGHTEDELFEVTLAAATGAAWARLERGLAAVRGKKR